MTTGMHARYFMKDLPGYLESSVGPVVLGIQASGSLGTEEKNGFRDIKTAGDTTAEKLIREYLQSRFPDHGIRGEEGTSIPGESEYEFVIDPIDGTTVYASGMNYFGISVGVMKNGVPYGGVIHFPGLEVTLSALADLGVFLNGLPLHPRLFSGEKSQLLIGVGLVKSTEHFLEPLKEYASLVVDYACYTVTALYVAQGFLKAYVHTGATPYDICAAVAIVRESGGVAVGIKDDAINMSAEKIPIILAGNMKIADDLRAVIAKTNHHWD